MCEDGVRFDQSKSKIVNSSDYHKGDIVGGCHVDPIGTVESDVRSVFDVNKPSRSYECDITDLEVGNLVDLSYKKSSNSVNTPYRVADISISEGIHMEKFDATKYNIKILFEPVIQNASLVIAWGFERAKSDSTNIVTINSVYHKRRWDDPEVQNFSEIEQPSELFDVGFEEKDRRITRVSILFDEVIAECVGIEGDLLPVLI